MPQNAQQEWADQVACLWRQIEAATPGRPANRFTLGMYFAVLRDLYSDRNSGGHRLTSRHGCFVEEIQKRGYRPRTVRQWIEDYVAALAGKPLSAAKRRLRRLHTSPTSSIDPLSAFAALLPFRAAQAAYREAAKVFHPDHGGDEQKMQRLNELWQQVKAHYQTQES